MPRVDVRELQNRFSDIAAEFDLELEEVRYLFVESLEDYFKNDVVLKSAGVEIAGRYKNIRQKEYRVIADIFREKLIRQSAYNYKKHLYTLLDLSGHILYATHDFTGKKYHYLIPFSNNKQSIRNFILYADKEQEPLPNKIEYFPVYVYRKVEKVHVNTFRAQCTFMNKQLLHRHVAFLEKRVKDALGFTISIVPIGVNKNDRCVIVSIRQQVTRAITNYIQRYFLSFHYRVIFKQRG